MPTYCKDFFISKFNVRITVSDFGDSNDSFGNEQQRMALTIMLKLVDDCEMTRLNSGKYQTLMDFTYDKDFDIADFLLKHEK